MLVSHTHGRAFFHIVGPFLVTVPHHFIARAYGSGRALSSTFLALCTKILQAEVNGLVHGKRKAGRDYRGLESETQEWIQHDIAYPAQRSQNGLEQNGRNDDLVVSGVMGAGRIPEPADIAGKDAEAMNPEAE